MLLVSSGRRDQSGRQIRVESIDVGPDGWNVTVVETEPAPGCEASQTESAPLVAMVLQIPRSDLRYTERKEAVRCRGEVLARTVTETEYR